MKNLLYFLLLIPNLLFGQITDPAIGAKITTYQNQSSTYTNEKAKIVDLFSQVNDSKANINKVSIVSLSGTNTYTGSISPAIASYAGLSVKIIPGITNTGSSSLNFNSVGAIAIKKESAGSLVDVVAGDLPAGVTKEVVFNGTFFQVIDIPQTSVSGNAATATALQTARTISITGDIAYTSPSFDGSGNVTAAGTLATVNGNVGSFGSATQTGTFTVNGKGLLTAAGNTTITPAVGSITGLGTGVGTFLATPSSANFASAVTGETGTGNVVFSDNPTFTNLSLPASTVETRYYGVACSDLTSALTTGTSKGYLTIPIPAGVTVTGVFASLLTAQTSGSILTIDINEAGTTILSTKLTIDNNEKDSSTAATAAVISDSSIAAFAQLTVDFDVVGTGGFGVIVWVVVR